MDGIDDALEEAAVKPQLDRSSIRDFADYFNIKDRYKSNDDELQYALKEISKMPPPSGKYPQIPYYATLDYLRKLPENRSEYWKPGKIPQFDEPDKVTKMPLDNAVGGISRGLFDTIWSKEPLRKIFTELKNGNSYERSHYKEILSRIMKERSHELPE